jgi:hypothetical protein
VTASDRRIRIWSGGKQTRGRGTSKYERIPLDTREYTERRAYIFTPFHSIRLATQISSLIARSFSALCLPMQERRGTFKPRRVDDANRHLGGRLEPGHAEYRRLQRN